MKKDEKHVIVDPDTHRKIKILSAITGIQIKVLIDSLVSKELQNNGVDL
jgi:hypothetical protein